MSTDAAATASEEVIIGAIRIVSPKAPKLGPTAAIVVEAYMPGTSALCGQAAALGFLWESGSVSSSDPKVTTRPPAAYRTTGSKPVLYGEAVLEELMKRGVPVLDIARAGERAKELLARHVVLEEEVAAAEGN